ncbi:MAG: sigma-70 family RNA polymerase sigma factor [Clostridia bacterium]|nr:sigma-70 family RNA polymerase sigma factor [Clostridia bacterium]
MTKEEFERRIIGLQDTLYRVAFTILPRPCDREDAIQECIYRALRKRDSLRDDDALQSWVIRILINECYVMLRRFKRERPTDELPEPEPQPDPDANPDVFRALYSLKRDLRLPLVLHYVEGYPLEDIARVLRIPCGTVKSRMARARKKLKLKLEEEADER